MRIVPILVTFMFVFIGPVYAQTTLTLQPGSEGKDASIHGLSSQSDVNRGTYPQFFVAAWTYGGVGYETQSLLDFDFSEIPPGAIVTSAYLTMYPWDDPNSGLGQHSNMSGPNNVWIERIVTSWEEDQVTWNTKPTSVAENRVELDRTTSPTQVFEDINVTALVNDMLLDSINSHGFMFRLKNPNYYRKMNFASSDHINEALHPKLVITYEEPVIGPVIDSLDSYSLQYPNVITPNGDGKNDVFKPSKSENVTVVSLKVYNRWGACVFESSEINPEWDVMSLDETQLSDGVYYYSSEYFSSVGKMSTVRGWVTLIR